MSTTSIESALRFLRYPCADATCSKEYLVNTDQFDAMYTPGLSGLQAQLFYLLLATCIFVPATKIFGFFFGKLIKKGTPLDIYYSKRNQLMFKSAYGINFEPHAARSFGLEVLSICFFQHMVGAALAVPYLFPAVREAFGWDIDFCVFLGRLGGICEAGWEIGDLLYRCYEKFVKGRHDLQPASLMTIIVLHHFLGMSMVVPMNLFFGAHPLYIETVFNLQLAAGIGLSCQQFGFMLDITKEGELLAMRFLAVMTFVSMWWMRGIRYCWVWIMFGLHFYALENWAMVAAVLVAGGSMFLMNALFCLDSTAKLKKFWFMTTAKAKERQAKEA